MVSGARGGGEGGRFKDVRTGESRETSINCARDDEAQEALEIYEMRKTGQDDSRMNE